MLGYLVYGENVRQIIVWNLPHHIPLVRLLNISLLLNVLSTFPIQLFPAIETVEGLVFARKSYGSLCDIFMFLILCTD